MNETTSPGRSDIGTHDVTVRTKGRRRIERGHPWVFDGDIRPQNAETPPGMVRVRDERGDAIAHALYSPRSKIALRIVQRGAEPPPDDWWRERLAAAIAFRTASIREYDGYRLVHSEADGLPGLTIDRYGDYLVVQQHSAALEDSMGAIVDELVGQLQPTGVLARNDSTVRELEGLPRYVRVLHGEVPDHVPYHEDDVELRAAPWRGQKTGAFLDQRENHVAARRHARGRALDVFTYHGGFALQLARHADEVVAVDSSAAALEEVLTGAARNGIGNLQTVRADAFAFLDHAAERGDRYDTVVLDPPAFAKGRAHVDAAVAGYKQLNLRAMSLLAPGGILVTASCSHHVPEPLFYGMLEDAAADAGVTMRVLERRRQASCHPEILGFPESGYLKLAVLQLAR